MIIKVRGHRNVNSFDDGEGIPALVLPLILLEETERFLFDHGC